MDATDTNTIKQQIQDLQSVVGELIDLKTGNPWPNTTKEQLLYAIEEINKIQSIYDRRAKERESLNREFGLSSIDIKKVGSNMSRINKKYGGNVFPKWFLEIFGA